MPLIVVFCLGWVTGIWSAAQVSQPWWAWLILAALAGGGLFALRKEPCLRLPLAFAVCLGLGGARHALAQPVHDQGSLAAYNDRGEVALEGVVWDAPDVRETRTGLRLRVDTLLLPGEAPRAVRGLALVYAPRYSESRLDLAGDGQFRYGDRVRVSGMLETPPAFEGFSYRDHLARQGVYSQVRQAQVVFVAARRGLPPLQALFDFKERALRVLAHILPEPHAALLQGILLGVESGIPADIQADFSTTGTSHVVAISG